MTASPPRTVQDGSAGSEQDSSLRVRGLRFRRRLALVSGALLVAVLLAGALTWLGVKASIIRSELQSAEQLVEQLKTDVVSDRKQQAEARVQQLIERTSAARLATEDPIWKMASWLPFVGANFSATTDVAQTSDDIAKLSMAPLVRVLDTLDWNVLLTGSGGANLEPIRASAPSVAAAADALRQSANRLRAIDASALMPQVADPLTRVKTELESVQQTIDTAANVAELAPVMLGAEGE